MGKGFLEMMMMATVKCPQRMHTRPRPDATAEIRRKCCSGGDNAFMPLGAICFFYDAFNFPSGWSRRKGPVNFPDCFKINSISNVL